MTVSAMAIMEFMKRNVMVIRIVASSGMVLAEPAADGCIIDLHTVPTSTEHTRKANKRTMARTQPCFITGENLLELMGEIS